MKKNTARWALPVLILMLLLLPIAGVAAQGSGNTLYLPVVSKALPQPPAAVKAVGPSGGTFTAVAVDPSNANILYAGTFGQGVNKSLDGGLSWQAANNGLTNWTIQSLAIRPDGMLFAGTYANGVYRSSDGGLNWQAVNSPADGVLEQLIIYDIEIAPTQPQTVFLSGRVPGGCYTADCELNGYIYKSTNGGSSWSQVWDSKTFFTIGDYSYDIEVDPTNAQIVYFTAHRNGVYKSTNGGGTWAPTALVSDKTARKLLIITDAPQTVYQSTYDTAGVYRTWNGGTTWETANTGLPPSLYGFALSRDTQNPDALYLGTGDRGVYKTSLSTFNWAQWGLDSNFIWAFAQVPGTSPAVYAGTDGNGLQYSSDGSANWQPRHAGILNTTITGLVTFNGLLYAGVEGGGVSRSSDQGATWQTVNSGLGNLNVQNLLVNAGGLYAVTTTNLYVSSDGVNWVVARSMPVSAPDGSNDPEAVLPFGERNALPEEEQFLLQPPAAASPLEGSVTPLAVSRPITSAARNWKGLWTGTAGGGIYLENGFCDYSNRTIFSMHVSQANGSLYASLTGPTGGTYYVVLWVQDNNINCGKWDTLGGELPNTTQVYSLSSSSLRTFAAASDGVYYLITTSQGPSFKKAAGISEDVFAVVADPTNPNLVYAGAETGAYISADGGLTWAKTARAELNGRVFISVLVDASNPNIVYFGSRDGSTYRWDKTLP